jgi:hypothetical protein
MNAVSATIFGDWRVISPKQDKMIEITAYYGVSLLSCSKKKLCKRKKERSCEVYGLSTGSHPSWSSL